MAKEIGIIVGSLREGSLNRLVAKTFESILPKEYEATWIEIGDLPLYNEDLDQGEIPAEWQRLRDTVQNVAGVMFFTPEYNRSVPAALKNAIDVGSRPMGENVWGGKPALVVSASPGAIGGFGANHHLRQSLVFVDMPILQQPEAYIGNVPQHLDGDHFDQSTTQFFSTILDSYLDFLERFTN
ncbi:NADPH-dependent FMN reductase [Pediococcus pentosaceus]|uniref:NAD(P)H-dependent oxidoreductase n=1 Tax=Pediococcus pentosaceus TaxID=1255 RepID=A0AB73HCN5_PEDPE|nr:NAD(P)H-dependent oxidoreductase [Pediococcus pentosaceus]MBF7114248.1 NAD(P)H-dependent oxidoreductase [Pediococcus pentosaceus]MCM6792080.1 NAD(P)H-dependent oxidoreductase [Pediococcus pentosaceus]MDN3206047.1 NAD(P)H-dependent oxidoreductase [Pediococcus pentosaceus]